MNGRPHRTEEPGALLRREIAALFGRLPCFARADVPRCLSHYEVRRKIGAGTNGIVYLAHDEYLDRRVAIKVLRAKLIQDPERRERFIREAQVFSIVNHPNVVTVHELDQDHGLDFVVMEYVPGRTLAQVTAGRDLGRSQALLYALQITSAVAAVHCHRITHRDLKPSNFIVSSNNTIKLLDFGLAKVIGTGK
jgi:serine/threonine protein kinase